jgi:hypothetical protein
MSAGFCSVPSLLLQIFIRPSFFIDPRRRQNETPKGTERCARHASAELRRIRKKQQQQHQQAAVRHSGDAA